MLNYIPADTKFREDSIIKNPLYAEVYLHRAESGCEECDYSFNGKPYDSDTCNSCQNNPKTLVEVIPLSQVKVSKLLNCNRKIRARHNLIEKILGKNECPLCINPEWSAKLLMAYFTDKDGNLEVAELEALFCPLCGKDLNKKE